METKIPEQRLIHEYSQELLKNPSFVKELTEYEKDLILKLQDKIINIQCMESAAFLAWKYKDFEYPEEYKDNHLMYWCENHIYNFQKAKRIKQIIIESRNNVPINTELYHTQYEDVPTVSSNRDYEKEKEIIVNHLKHLGGLNLKKEKIMDENEYKRLIELTFQLVFNGVVNADAPPFKLSGITKGSIKYSYYLIHLDIYGNRPIRNEFIAFLKSKFPALFDKWEFDVLRAKFSGKPQRYPF